MAGDDIPVKVDAPRDPTNPYYLGTHDGPGNIITTIVFRGDNFEEWSRSIRLSLMAGCKLEFLDGTIKKMTDTKKLVVWRCLQATIVQWILNTIDVSVKKTIPYFEEVKPLWDVLKRRFEVGSGPRKQQIKAALADCKQPKTMSVTDYFGLLQLLRDELATYNPLPTCKCGKCTCYIGEQFQKLVDEDRFHDFLYGINEELYGNVRLNFLAQDPLPTLDRAYQALLQEERLCSSSHTKAERDNVMTLAVKSQPPSRGVRRYGDKDKSGLMCSYCNWSGHEEANCFSKHGFPEWWGDRSRGGGRGSD